MRQFTHRTFGGDYLVYAMQTVVLAKEISLPFCLGSGLISSDPMQWREVIEVVMSVGYRNSLPVTREVV